MHENNYDLMHIITSQSYVPAAYTSLILNKLTTLQHPLSSKEAVIAFKTIQNLMIEEQTSHYIGKILELAADHLKYGD